MKITRFKQWYQVTFNGYTIAQFLSRSEAQAYIDIQRSPFHSQEAGLGNEYVSQRRGQTIRHINIYL